MKLRTCTTFLAVLICFSNVLGAQTDLRWIMGPELSEKRAWPTVVKLNDSTAIVMGGWHNEAFGDPTNTCDFIHASMSGISASPAPRMAKARTEFPAYLMGDSAVVVFGGVGENGEALRDVEVFNIRTNRWTQVGQLRNGRRQHVAYPIGGGKFVVVGGRRSDLSTQSSAEIFDVVNGTSQQMTDYPVAVNGAIGTTTSTGKGVIFGGRDGGANSGRTANISRYDLTSNSWQTFGTLSFGREAPMSFKLRDGRVVIVGGAAQEERLILSTEVVIESDDTFRVVTNNAAGRLYCALGEYQDGEVVIVGGQDVTEGPVSSTQFVSATTGEVKAGPLLNVKRYRTRAVSLRSNATSASNRWTVVVVGGTWKFRRC